MYMSNWLFRLLGACGEALCEMNLCIGPVNLWVVLIKPVHFQYNIVIANISDIELDVLFMVCRAIVVVNANALEGKVCKVAHNIF